MPARISLLLPTRGRPRLVQRFLDSVAAHSRCVSDVEVVLHIDEDDVASHTIDHSHIPLVKLIEPFRSMGACNTACFVRASGEVIILMNDDVIIRTPGWDEALLAYHASVGDQIYLAYGNDLFKGKRVCSFPILSRRTCRLLGEPFPARYRGGLIDYHLLDVFKRLDQLGHARIRYFPNLIFEHTHYRTGKLPFDETYARRERFGDDWTFIALRDQRRLAARTLAAAISGEDVHETQRSTPGSQESNGSLARDVATFGRMFLLDDMLPIAWRAFLFYWFVGRRLAVRFGFAGPAAAARRRAGRSRPDVTVVR